MASFLFLGLILICNIYQLVAIHFGIVCSFVPRIEDPYYMISRLTSIPSIKSQTFRNWTLIAIGDGLTRNSTRLLFTALALVGISPERVVFLHNNESNREINIYRNNKVPLGPCTVWCFAGTNALNMGLDLCYNSHHRQRITHIARLDDDDTWLPGHLENHVKIYNEFPQAGFVYTQSYFLGNNEPYYLPADNSSISPVLAPPRACGLIHSTVTWSMKALNVRFQHAHEQYRLYNASTNSRPNMSVHRCKFTNNRVIFPVDADLWYRVHALVSSNKLVSVFLPLVDVNYTDTNLKKALILQGEANREHDHKLFMRMKKTILQSWEHHFPIHY
eukprot:gene8903-18427_t